VNRAAPGKAAAVARLEPLRVDGGYIDAILP
jgi:hypothetical protein